MRVLAVMWVLGVACASAGAEWEMQESHTTASLRGIHAVSGTVAWASGTEGTVLRTVDGGKHWTKCAVPEGAEKLDFRGVQGFDEKTAIVMSSGKGDLSRLYKTVDGCGTWKLVGINAAKEGFWDSIAADSAAHATVLGDSVRRATQLCDWNDGDDIECGGEPASEGEGSFAASNSVLQVSNFKQIDPVWKSERWWASEDKTHIYFHVRRSESTLTCEPCRGEYLTLKWNKVKSGSTSGIFSFRFRDDLVGVAVGGDYTLPDKLENPTTFIGYTLDGGLKWDPSQTFPGGYRSSVAYNETAKQWITVGPNGTDVSTDDGKNWKAVGGENAAGWNALSLPFVVGPKGRIGVWKVGAK